MSLVQLRYAAEQGDTEAQFQVGCLHMHWVKTKGDQGLQLGQTKSIELLHRAAESGHKGAQLLLGSMYPTGDIVPQDRARAAQILGQAAD